jgi:hypothetical protein
VYIDLLLGSHEWLADGEMLLAGDLRPAINEWQVHTLITCSERSSLSRS